MNSYNSIEEIREILVPLGFHEYKPPQLKSYEGVCTMFQKRYDDDYGKKYFIDAKVWDWSWTDKVKENFHIEYECQLYQIDTHDAFNLTFIDWKLEQVEKFIEDMFNKCTIEHYELWDDV